MLVSLKMVCTVLLVIRLALVVVGPTSICVLLKRVLILRGTAFPRMAIPKRPPPVTLMFPVTVVAILRVPFKLHFMIFPLLFMMMTVVKANACLFPAIPAIWPTVIS